MPITLHGAFVPSALQMLGTADHLLGKCEKWCAERDCSHETVIGARLIDDMLPFSYQIKSVAEHTAGAVEGIRAGVYSPDLNPPPTTFDDLRAKLNTARETLKALDEVEMESWVGRDMRFEFKDTKLDFTAEDFLLSFSQPNYYFHASVAFSIARMLGVSIGKTNFLGAVRIKPN